jgi:hypothetical protein
MRPLAGQADADTGADARGHSRRSRDRRSMVRRPRQGERRQPGRREKAFVKTYNASQSKIYISLEIVPTSTAYETLTGRDRQRHRARHRRPRRSAQPQRILGRFPRPDGRDHQEHLRHDPLPIGPDRLVQAGQRRPDRASVPDQPGLHLLQQGPLHEGESAGSPQEGGRSVERQGLDVGHARDHRRSAHCRQEGQEVDGHRLRSRQYRNSTGSTSSGPTPAGWRPASRRGPSSAPTERPRFRTPGRPPGPGTTTPCGRRTRHQLGKAIDSPLLATARPSPRATSPWPSRGRGQSARTARWTRRQYDCQVRQLGHRGHAVLWRPDLLPPGRRHVRHHQGFGAPGRRLPGDGRDHGRQEPAVPPTAECRPRPADQQAWFDQFDAYLAKIFPGNNTSWSVLQEMENYPANPSPEADLPNFQKVISLTAAFYTKMQTSGKSEPAQRDDESPGAIQKAFEQASASPNPNYRPDDSKSSITGGRRAARTRYDGPCLRSSTPFSPTRPRFSPARSSTSWAAESRA